MKLRSANRMPFSALSDIAASASKRKAQDNEGTPASSNQQTPYGQGLGFSPDCDSSMDEAESFVSLIHSSGATDRSVDCSQQSSSNINVSLLGQMNLSVCSDNNSSSHSHGNTTAASNISFSPSVDYGIASNSSKRFGGTSSGCKPPRRRMDSPRVSAPVKQFSYDVHGNSKDYVTSGSFSIADSKDQSPVMGFESVSPVKRVRRYIDEFSR
jgi:hypothetical protein